MHRHTTAPVVSSVSSPAPSYGDGQRLPTGNPRRTSPTWEVAGAADAGAGRMTVDPNRTVSAMPMVAPGAATATGLPAAVSVTQVGQMAMPLSSPVVGGRVATSKLPGVGPNGSEPLLSPHPRISDPHASRLDMQEVVPSDGRPGANGQEQECSVM